MDEVEIKTLKTLLAELERRALVLADERELMASASLRSWATDLRKQLTTAEAKRLDPREFR